LHRKATSNGFSIWEFQVFGDDSQSSNLALGKTAYASSQEASFLPANAFDGNMTTRWSSAYTDSQSLW